MDQKQVKLISKQVKKEIITTVLFWLGILSIIFGIGFWQAYIAGVQEMRHLLVQRISKEFEEPAIKKTIHDVASAQAKSLINDEITPDRKKITDQIADFRNYLNDTQRQFDENFIEISKEVDFLKKRNNLLRLADQAITNPLNSVNALKTLYAFMNSDADPAMREMAISEILRIKVFYISGSRIAHFSIKAIDRVGPIRTDGEIPTDNLISKLADDPDWRVQVKAAELLSSRHEKGVPQALLTSVCTSSVLDVVRVALSSFMAVTGFKSNDVFGCGDNACDCEVPTNWWKENEQRVTTRLSDPKP